MFKFFIVTFEVLALVMVLRTSFVQFWLSDIQSSAADWMLEMSMLIDNQQLEKLRAEISPHTQNLNGYQRDYLRQITDNKAALGSFNQFYCQNGDKNPYIYGASLHYVCSEIGRTGILKS
ncbi:hypothetical protein L0668_11585 [Paraglaciecola aquimarina]|uniref:Uncharacterized protein n=1 Tax=Paraglaciecola algarum TaxID=3050085 RepID=A0ABS9D736_9ALTE|nr:hypothetical protein [Paraglaciecola sp. G1-23]MCF2948751.1 hypothetical protein [Paraglaciecola sp. G1-23]